MYDNYLLSSLYLGFMMLQLNKHIHSANRNIKLFLYNVARNITGVMATFNIDSNTFPWKVQLLA